MATIWQRCQRHATHMPFERAGSQYVSVRAAGRPGTVAMSKAGFRELHVHAEQAITKESDRALRRSGATAVTRTNRPGSGAVTHDSQAKLGQYLAQSNVDFGLTCHSTLMVKPIPVAQERTQIGRSSQYLSLKRTIDLGLGQRKLNGNM